MNTQVNQSVNAEYQEVAEKWCSILTKRDAAILSEIFYEDAEVWHSYDQKTMTMQEITEAVDVVFSAFKEMGLKNIQRSFIENGFVQRHNIVGTHVNGAPLNVAACVFVTVKDGKISRLEEYIDPAPLLAILSPN